MSNSESVLHTDAEKVAALRVLLDISCALSAKSELLPLLQLIQEAALRVLDCERASIFLYDRKSEELFSRVATGGVGIRFPANKGIAGEALQNQSLINVPDAYADPRFNPEVDRKTGFRTRNILTSVLLGLNDQPVGVLQVLNKRGRCFDEWDEELVRTFTAQAGMALQRQMLMDEYVEKQRLQKDLEIARTIQLQLLPREPLSIPGYDLAGWYQPADETGGDSYDYQTLPTGRVAVVIGDVTGHGVGPALIASECRALLRASLSLTEELDRITPLVNELLSFDLPPDRFVTALVAVLDPETHEFRYVSAGQGPLLHYRAAIDSVVELETQGPPLGVAPGFPYDPPLTLRIEPGDLLVFLTDGFYEWDNVSGQQLGPNRVGEMLRKHHLLPAEEIIRAIYRETKEFTQGTRQNDDLTAVVLRRRL